MANDTIIVVGVTRMDTYGNLWVLPAGGGDEIKIGEKRPQLHDLFQQGKAVMLHWETYKNKPYVSDAKLVEGELPAPQPSNNILPEHKEVIDEATRVKPAPQELGMWWKELGEMIRANDIDITQPIGIALKNAYYAQMLSVLPIKIEEAKNETNKDTSSSQETQTELTDKQDSGETTDEERVSGFFKYLEKHGIQDVKLWLSVEYGIDPAETLKPKNCEALYKAIKKDKGW